jgi:uncharacterized protein HemX
MSTTPPGPPPGPPSAPPPGPPAAPPPSPAQPAAAPPKKRSGGNIWLVLFIVAAVLFVGALVFAIISFTGKNSESDAKEKAQKELAATKGQLGSSQQKGETLGGLLTQASSAADTLKSCTDSSGNLREGMIDAINVVQNGGGINERIDALNQQINDNRSSCQSSDQAYQDLLNALDRAGGK